MAFMYAIAVYSDTKSVMIPVLIVSGSFLLIALPTALAMKVSHQGIIVTNKYIILLQKYWFTEHMAQKILLSTISTVEVKLNCGFALFVENYSYNITILTQGQTEEDTSLYNSTSISSTHFEQLKSNLSSLGFNKTPNETPFYIPDHVRVLIANGGNFILFVVYLVGLSEKFDATFTYVYPISLLIWMQLSLLVGIYCCVMTITFKESKESKSEKQQDTETIKG